MKDLRAVAGPGLAGVLLPKIQSPADVHALDALLTCIEVANLLRKIFDQLGQSYVPCGNF